MSIVIIRAHERFAICRRVSLRNGDTCAGEGLLIEISLEGCRVSRVEQSRFRECDLASFWIEDFGRVAGVVHWSRTHGIGLRFSQPLHQGELARLLEILRREPATEHDEARLYGT